MSLIFNGTEVKTIIYNDQNNSNVVLDKLIIDSTQVYTRSITLKVVYGSNVSSVKVNNSTISNGGTFEYQSGQTLSIVVTYDGYVTGDGYIHSVNNNTTVNSTRWKYNTNYTISGISKTVSVSNNLSTASDTISFSLTDTEISNLQSATNTITFNATKTGTQTYKENTITLYTPDSPITTTVNRIYADNNSNEFNEQWTHTYNTSANSSTNITLSNGSVIGNITFDFSGNYTLNLSGDLDYWFVILLQGVTVKGSSGKVYYSNVEVGTWLNYQYQQLTASALQTSYNTTYYWE